ncbi:YitT family protein [Clostridium hydrogeniformans]|uniref:YitT family protein n=1 Tax=Clostridium hydrogeniformans TaxID=349933 RepID=UPI000690BBDC|nr:YitT family protein [Clostridium hydrogeniformans]
MNIRKITRNKHFKIFIDYFMLTLGALLSAIAIELIMAPNGVVDSGTTALSVIINHLFGFPLFINLIILNGIILSFTAKKLYKTFCIRTIYSNIIASLWLYLLKPVPPVTTSEFLIVLYGGVILGVGVGIVIKYGGAIDGSEMLSIWINKTFNIPISAVLFTINCSVLVVTALVFNIEQAMFSLAIIYIMTKIVDLILSGLNQCKSVLIISSKYEEIGKTLIEDHSIPITYLKGNGGYSGEDYKIIYCITDKIFYPHLKDVVLNIDDGAIMQASTVSETHNVRKSSLTHITKNIRELNKTS